MGASFYRNAECCVLVCDLTDAKSFETIDTWRQEFLTQLAPKVLREIRKKMKCNNIYIIC